jgi:hypothetical protein
LAKKPEPTPDLPVYLFTGFLDAGKTRFIQETLEDSRFHKGERTLLLLCEEGEEEYEPTHFCAPNVFLKTVDEERDLTTANLAAMAAEVRPERVIVEYNGMWTLDTLYQNLPENWIVAQEFLFCDAQTFLTYNANMRQLMVDKLKSAELVVLNRYNDDMDRMELHKVIRGVSRRCDIAYEYASDGHVDYDDIEDPLPFDIEKDEIVIEDRDFALFYRDIMEEPAKYDGKTVTFKGLAARNPKFPPEVFAMGRNVMTCCVEDIQFCWFVTESDDPSKRRERGWSIMKAKISVQKHKFYRGKGPVLHVIEITDSAPPEKEVATFY